MKGHGKNEHSEKRGKHAIFENRGCKPTGLSQYFLRRGCRDGSVPHVMSGTVYLVNVPALLRKLGAAEGGTTE